MSLISFDLVSTLLFEKNCKILKSKSLVEHKILYNFLLESKTGNDPGRAIFNFSKYVPKLRRNCFLKVLTFSFRQINLSVSTI